MEVTQQTDLQFFDNPNKSGSKLFNFFEAGIGSSVACGPMILVVFYVL
jgi:hypothetical protein